MTDLYPSPANITDFVSFLNFTTSNVCMDVTNPSTCGSWMFFDFFLGIFFLILLIGFKYRHSLKESYAGSSLIIALISGIIFAMPNYTFLRGYDLIFWIANAFISIMLLYLVKD
jgi:glucan phosphoethanolaminetransferase (alkaline phosphatase superfamily)